MSQITLSKKVLVGLGIAAVILVGVAGYAGYSVSNKVNDNDEPKTSTKEEKEFATLSETELKKVEKKIEEEKKTEETKTVLTPDEVIQVEQQAQQKITKEYTNPYFPTLKLPYTSDWNFSTSTDTLDQEKGLLNRRVTFTNKLAKVDVYLRSIPFNGCGSGPQTIISSEKIGSQFKTIFQNQNPETNQNIEPLMIAYGANKGDTSPCNQGKIVSNIDKKSYSGYNDFVIKNNLAMNDIVYNQSKVVYHYTIGVGTPNQDNNAYFKPEDPAVADIDKLITGFQF